VTIIHDAPYHPMLWRHDDVTITLPDSNENSSQWPAWQHDQNLAAVYAPQIADAFTGGMAAAEAFLAQMVSGEVRVTPTYAAQEISRLLATSLRSVMTPLWTEGYALGTVSARHAVASLPPAPTSTASADSLITKLTSDPYPQPVTGPDWGGWQPGDAEAAAKIATGPRLLQLLHQWGISIIQAISQTKLKDLAALISNALNTGKPASALAQDITSLLNVPARAQMIAQTELSRATAAATLDTYLRSGVSTKQVLVAPDERVCKACWAAEDEGAIPLSQPFLSGVDAPPFHPSCRCALSAASVGDFDLSNMTVEPLPGFNLVPLGKQHSGEGSVTCDHGHKHWGEHGAAGILIRAPRPSGELAYLLQQRASAAYDSAGRWSIFGGALLPDETPLAGATREVNEEIGHVIVMDGNAPSVTKVGPHGYVHGWIKVADYDDIGTPKATGTYVGYPLVGASVLHPTLGFGNITAMSPDKSRVTVSFQHGAGVHDFPAKVDDDANVGNDFKDAEPEETTPVSLNKPFNYGKLSATKKKAVIEYTKPTTIVNHRLRHYDFAVNDSVVKTLDNLAKERSFTADATLYRGVALTPEMLSSMVPGASFTDKAYTSLSDKPSAAKVFAQLRATGKNDYGDYVPYVEGSTPALMLVHIPAGTNVFQGEPGLGEYVLPRGMTTTINAVSEDGRVFDVSVKPSVPETQKMMASGYLPEVGSRFVHEASHGTWTSSAAAKSVAVPVLSVRSSYIDDHGGWSYTTFLADAPETFWPAFDGETPEESAGWGWFTPNEMKSLPLHPGFKATLPKILASVSKVSRGIIFKVGPEGYVHGWVYVGPEAGGKVTHPEHGVGSVAFTTPLSKTAIIDYAGGKRRTYAARFDESAEPHLEMEYPVKPGESLRGTTARMAVPGKYDVDEPVEYRFGQKLTEEQAIRKAVRSYAANGFKQINAALRVNNGDAGRVREKRPDVASQVDAIDKAEMTSTLTQPVEVWRGAQDGKTMLSAAWRPDSSMVGASWIDDGYTSTSTEQHTAHVFGADFARDKDISNVMIKLNVPAGIHAIAVGGDSDHDENEILLDRGLQYTVTSDDGKDEDGIRRLTVAVSQP
jgi:hypothetical protein